MITKRVLTLIFFIAIFWSTSFATPIIATTEDGKKVLLRDDGSWKFATQSDEIAVKMMKPNTPDKAVEPNADASGTETGTIQVQQKSPASDEPERAGFLEVVKGDKAFDIRKAMWGMEKSDVKKTEALQLVKESPNSLEYKFKLIGLDSKILYKFAPDKSGKMRLSGAQYRIEQDDVNPAKFYEDYKSLRGYLRQLYGFPISDENSWNNDIYKADEKNWGFAISLGFLSCHAIWKNTRTKITLNSSGSNHILSTSIEYGAILQ